MRTGGLGPPQTFWFQVRLCSLLHLTPTALGLEKIQKIQVSSDQNLYLFTAAQLTACWRVSSFQSVSLFLFCKVVFMTIKPVFFGQIEFLAVSPLENSANSNDAPTSCGTSPTRTLCPVCPTAPSTLSLCPWRNHEEPECSETAMVTMNPSEWRFCPTHSNTPPPFFPAVHRNISELITRGGQDVD